MTKLDPHPDGPRGTAVVGGFVATAGQRPADDAGSAGFAAAFESALARAAAALEAGGGAPDRVLQVRVFVTDMRASLASRQALHASLAEHFGGRVPPTTV